MVFYRVFFFLHFIIYFFYSKHKEFSYLKSDILGVDLTLLTNKFKAKLDNNKQNIDEDEAIRILNSVESESLSKEHQLFCINKDLAQAINDLSYKFKFKIYLFCDSFKNLRTIDFNELIEQANHYCNDSFSYPFFKVILVITKKLNICSLNCLLIKYIARRILRLSSFVYDKLIFEDETHLRLEPVASYINRFNISRKRKIRFFVESDILRAIKLSFICNVVFLLSSQSNSNSENNLRNGNCEQVKIPSNLIRVKSWDEILEQIERIF